MKIAPVFLTLIIGSLLAACTGCSPSNRQDNELPVLENKEDFSWPEGKRAAISLTFDDARESQITTGIPILDKYDVKATFYVLVRNFEKQQDAWKRVAENGHEIGNHSLNHPCSGNFSFIYDRALEDYTLDKMRHELVEANNIIEERLGVKPVSFAYPCGQKFVGRGRNLKSYVPVVAEEFMTGRGWMDEWANDPAFCDMANLMAMELDGENFEQVKQLIDRTLADGGWLIFCGHDIGDGGRQTTYSSTLKALCEYAKDSANGIWLDSVQAVASHIRGQRTVTGK